MIWYLSFSYTFSSSLLLIVLLFYSLPVNAQEKMDSVRLSTVPVLADTAVIKIELEDPLPYRLSDEEMRIFIMRIMRYGSPEKSMLNDPFFAPGERFYGLFSEHRSPLLSEELLVVKLIGEQMRLELNGAKKAARAGTVYKLLQWLLIFL
jgi:hypothetical protein